MKAQLKFHSFCCCTALKRGANRSQKVFKKIGLNYNTCKTLQNAEIPVFIVHSLILLLSISILIPSFYQNMFSGP